MANEQNLIPQSQRTKEEQREIARQGGIASGKVRREKKKIADALRAILNEPISAGSELTKLEALTQKVVKKAFEEGSVKDLKTIQEILGEATQKIEIEQLPPVIQVDSQETADKLQEILKKNEND